MNCDLNQGDQCAVNHRDLVVIKRDYCSVTPGVLQFSPTNKNSRPENYKVVLGIEFWFRILTDLLVPVVFLEEVNPSR